jgi:hypothetical protein
VKIEATTGPNISQPRLFAIVLAALVLAAILSAHVHRIDKSRLLCAKLNQRMVSQLTWDGDGCVLKD